MSMGHEVLRVGLNGEEKLAITLDPGPLSEDPWLWGILLADVAGTAADAVGRPPGSTSEALVAADSGDVSDRELARKMIARAFAEAVSFGFGDSIRLERLGAGARPVEVGDLRGGDRFVCDNHLFLLTVGPHRVAVNMADGSLRAFEANFEVIPVRRRRD